MGILEIDFKIPFDSVEFTLPLFFVLLGLGLFLRGLYILISNTSRGGAVYNKEYAENRATGITDLILAGILTLISLSILWGILALWLSEDIFWLVLLVPFFLVFLIPGIILMVSGIRRLKKRSSMQNSS